MSEAPHRYFIINKPNNMVSQFVSNHKVMLLGDLDFQFPEGTHAIGRLDINSEGLLILTTNKRVTKLLFQGEVPHSRTYLVRVRKIVTPDELQQLRDGVTIRVKEGADYTTPPCKAELVLHPPNLMDYQLEHNPRILHSWLYITLEEGKHRQVRKMVAAIGHQCKRLIRVSIEDLELGALPPGEVIELEEEDFFRKLRIDNWRPPDNPISP